MAKNRDRWDVQLGMKYGTASWRLQRLMLFWCAQDFGLDNCYRCGEKMDSVNDFTIDHIQPWIGVSSDLFWDVNNIAFSHMRCNIQSARHTHVPKYTYSSVDESSELYQKMLKSILGASYGTAKKQLARNLIFHFWGNRYGKRCYQCGEEIESISDMSIEHKTPWLDIDPKLFWDKNNISLSHKLCTYGAARQTQKIEYPDGMGWCWKCKMHKPLSEFYKNSYKGKGTQNGYSRICKVCTVQYRRDRDIKLNAALGDGVE